MTCHQDWSNPMNARVDALHRPSADAPLREVSVDDKYTALHGSIYLSGIQALVRLPLLLAGRWRSLMATSSRPAPSRGSPTGNFRASPFRRLITEGTAGRAEYLNATSLATALLGDAIAANLFLLGYAFQRGGCPCHLPPCRAIEINGVAVASNVRAFQ
jgi:indolepyruvate ferredoxin oxidoreductase